MAAEQARPWEEAVGRVGYGARAGLYILIGCFALAAVVRLDPRQPKGVSEALRTLVHEPGGRWLLGALALGLLAHALWRGAQAAADLEHVGHALRGVALRIGYALVGLFYAGLCVETVLLMVHRARPDGSERHTVAAVLAHPLGRFVVLAIGVGLLIFGVVELVAAWRARFVHDFDGRRMGRTLRRTIAIVGRVGVGARGLVFGIAGVLLMHSAWRARADTVGTGDVLRRVAGSAFGLPAVAVLAVGLFAYAGLMLAEAGWRRMSRRDR